MIDSLLVGDKKIIETLEIISDGDYKRIDLFLYEKLQKSRSYFKNLIDENLVLINGRICKPSSKVFKDDIINVYIPDESIDLTPKEIPFDILYDSKWYAVINKPAGLVVHPAPGNVSDTLVNGLLARFEIDDNEMIRPGIVHRLDKDTSGLLLVAKNRDVRQKLSELFQQREVKKVYLAICCGKPTKNFFRLENKIGRSPNDRKKMTVVQSDGKEAISEVKILAKHDNIFLAAVRIYTGRTHQIRVHMTHLGYPIVGDLLYGGNKVMKFGIERQALHAYYLSFRDPFMNETKRFIAPIPQDIKYLMIKYGLEFDNSLVE